MRIIKTRRKKIAFLVDDIDMPLIETGGWTWSVSNRSTWYISRMCNGKKEYLHRLIIGAKKGQTVDHINGNTLDNRRQNLRLCTQSDNAHNMRKVRSDNTSGFKGVCYKAKTKRWRAYINLKRRQVYLGMYLTKGEAARAYDNAAKRLFGEFAATNL